MHALASALDLEVVQTRYRGHAAAVAEAAAREGYGLVLTLGGDGTVNEAVNGLLRARPPGAVGGGPPPRLPCSPPCRAGTPTSSPGPWACPRTRWTRPGGFSRSLPAGRTRTIGLGLADGRYFCFNAGLGLDAEVVRVVEGLRARGRAASAALYVRTTVRQFTTVTDRREPALTLERDGVPALDGLFLGI